MWSDITYWFRRKWYQIKRVIDFLPIIWKGYDFDYRYSLDLFKHSLERQAKFMESDKAVSMEAEQSAKEIRTFIKLLDKVYDEEYGCEYQEKLEELYGEWNWEFVELDEKDENGDSYYKMNAWYENQDETTEEVKDRLFNESKEKQEKAHRILWSYLAHKIRGWWD